MAKSTKGAFDEILEKFGSDEDRQTFQDLSEKNPLIKESVLRQSDYSRRMDELRDDITELNDWRSWRQNNWDDESKMTKTELEKLSRLEALQSEKAQLESRILLEGGGDVDFNELEKWGTEFIKKQGLVSPADMTAKLDAKEKEVKDFVTGMNRFSTKAATRLAYLNIKHNTEFGEPFDPDVLLQDAIQKGQFEDLDKFYESQYAEPARHKKLVDQLAKEKTDLEAKVTQAKEDGIKEGRAAAGAVGASPTDDSGAAMGEFQKKYLGLGEKPKDGETGAPEVPLGDGGIAAYAAQKFARTGSL